MLHLTNSIGTLAMSTGLSSYLMKKRKSMLAVSSGSTIIWAMYYLLEEAHTAAAMVLIAAARIALGAYALNWTARTRLLVTAAILSVVGLCAHATWEGAISLPATLASVLLAVATLNFTYQRLRIALLVGDALWLWNGITLHSTFATMASVLGLLINGVVMLKQSDLRQKMQFSTRTEIQA